MVERYSSGSSLSRTTKEEGIDYLERALWTEFTDEFFVALKKLSIGEIRQLHNYIAERLSDTVDRCPESFLEGEDMVRCRQAKGHKGKCG